MGHIYTYIVQETKLDYSHHRWDTNIPSKNVPMLWQEFKAISAQVICFLLVPRIYKNAHPGYLGLEENKGTKTSQKSDKMIQHKSQYYEA